MNVTHTSLSDDPLLSSLRDPRLGEPPCRDSPAGPGVTGDAERQVVPTEPERPLWPRIFPGL